MGKDQTLERIYSPGILIQKMNAVNTEDGKIGKKIFYVNKILQYNRGIYRLNKISMYVYVNN